MKLNEVKKFLVFDTETTGVNVKKDRILTASLVRSENKAITSNTIWINPGVSIPSGATNIHGITDEKIKEVGADPVEALCSVKAAIYDAWEDGFVLVAHNMAYDASILDAELRRHQLGSFDIKGPLVDTMVLFRIAGNQKASLDAATKKYGIINKTAHSSESDCMATLELLFKIIEHNPMVAEKNLRELYTAQRVSHRNWAVKTRKYFENIGKSFHSTGNWPKEEEE